MFELRPVRNLEIPHKFYLTINDTIYILKKSEPDVTYKVSMYELYQNPNRKLHIDHTKTLSPELKQKISEVVRLSCVPGTTYLPPSLTRESAISVISDHL